MRHFEIIDARRQKRGKPCAMLHYSESTRTFTISISPSAGTEDVPLMFVPFIQRGEREIGSEWALTWVRERIVPPSRQNIAEVLEANGLEEYDELALLLSRKGMCCQDEFMVREVVPQSTPEGIAYACISLDDPHKAAKSAFGEQLARARKNAGLSQAELGWRAGVAQANVSQIERGLANPTLETMSALAQAAGLSLILKIR